MITSNPPSWIDPSRWIDSALHTTQAQVKRALEMNSSSLQRFAALISPQAQAYLEPMSRLALSLTRSHFGKTVSLYVPLYLSNYCSGGCAYCGFAGDRRQQRKKLDKAELAAEIMALKDKGFDDVLLLTGERSSENNVGYISSCIKTAKKCFHNVSVESFSMTVNEYKLLFNAGCTGITLYQETYNPLTYAQVHRWGEKRNYQSRLEAPERALSAGLRTVGLGVLLGLSDPVHDVLSLYMHAEYLKRKFWQSGILISFPRICPEQGGYVAAHPVDERLLAQLIFAFRICMPGVPLVLSTRERPVFRDGIAGIGITKMSAESRTTVGGYSNSMNETATCGQFDNHDKRPVDSVCRALRKKGLYPVFKNWDAVFECSQKSGN